MKKIAEIITLTFISLTIFLWQGCVILSSTCWGCDTDEEIIHYGYIYLNDTDTSELFHFRRALNYYSQDERNHIDSNIFDNTDYIHKEPLRTFLGEIDNNFNLLDSLDTLYNKGIYDEVLILSISVK
ncbi:MAG: hypothetical protein IKZ99_09370 [Salinivirgaceae bacterium]|nr:hypothetical protein [Salinivirgaceae bacterium]